MAEEEGAGGEEEESEADGGCLAWNLAHELNDMEQGSLGSSFLI